MVIGIGLLTGILSIPATTTYALSTATNNGLTSAQSARLTAIKTKGDRN